MNVPVHLVGSHRRHIGKSLRLGSMGVGWSRLESAVNGQARTPRRGSGKKGGGTGSASGTGKGLGCAGRFINLVAVGMGSVLKGCCEGWPWVVFCVRRVHCTLGYERLLNSSMTWQAVLVILFVWLVLDTTSLFPTEQSDTVSNTTTTQYSMHTSTVRMHRP